MFKVYISPSTQEKNLYVNGGTEEEYMNKIADALVPYLVSSGIKVYRNTPRMTAASSIQDSNAIGVDLHVAIHSNASGGENSGLVQGSDIFYYPTSKYSKEFSKILVNNFKKIYPEPSLVKAVSNEKLGEIKYTYSPAALIEVAFHDNLEDATWIKENIETIAYTIAKSITEYFGIPLVEPIEPYPAIVNTKKSNLNIRKKPNMLSHVIFNLPKDARVTVLGKYDDWVNIEYKDRTGFAKAQYIKKIAKE